MKSKIIMNKNSKIYVAGHTGLVGSAIMQTLQQKGYANIVTRTFEQLDLTSQEATRKFFEKEKPVYVILAAAKVGGIMANNTYRGEFIYENLMIQSNVIHACYQHGVKKLLFLGSSCIYPREAPQPLQEDYLLTSELEYTNEPYAIAKIAGIKMCENYNLQYGTDFLAVMPTNLYGPNDNYDLDQSHVLPALLRKMHLGKLLMNNKKSAILNDLKEKPISSLKNKTLTEDRVEEILEPFGINRNKDNTVSIALWGSGSPMREFLHAHDMAKSCIYIMENIQFADVAQTEIKPGTPPEKEIRNTHINIGTGKDITIKELANLIKQIVGFEGPLVWDTSKPDGTPRKLLNVDKINSLGWKPSYTLQEGIEATYAVYVGN